MEHSVNVQNKNKHNKSPMEYFYRQMHIYD